jgi:hypothetical protein
MAIKHRNLDGYDTPPIEWDRVRQTIPDELAAVDASGCTHSAPRTIRRY